MAFTMKKIYDPLKGKPIREMRSSDIVQIAAPHSAYSSGTIASTALDSDTELFITGISYSAQTATDFYVTVNTATILPAYLPADGKFTMTAKLDAPLYKASASSTISICIGSAGTVSAFLYGVRFPKFEKVEV